MAASEVTAKDTVRRLHIGGKQVREGWEIFNIQPGAGVNFVGDVADLSQFNDETFDRGIRFPRHRTSQLPKLAARWTKGRMPHYQVQRQLSHERSGP